MKKIYKVYLLLLAICIFAITSFTNNIYAISVTNYKPKYGLTTTAVNFRAISSTKKGKLGTLAKNTNIKILATTGEFYIIQLANNEIGCISSKYVKTASSAPKGAQTYTMVTKSIKSTSSNVVLRSGPGTNFAKRMTLKKNTAVTVLGYISNWYVVITDNGNVGCIRKDLLATTTSNNTSTSNNTTSNTGTSNVAMTDNEKLIFNLINNARTKKGLNKLNANAQLFKLANLKSDDMVKKEYFSHTSPTYGDPFKMLTANKITYKVAGENIAGNPDLEDAVNAWLNSETHKENILSNSYNYVGVGIAESPIYGYVISVLFIGK